MTYAFDCVERAWVVQAVSHWAFQIAETWQAMVGLYPSVPGSEAVDWMVKCNPSPWGNLGLRPQEANIRQLLGRSLRSGDESAAYGAWDVVCVNRWRYVSWSDTPWSFYHRRFLRCALERVVLRTFKEAWLAHCLAMSTPAFWLRIIYMR
jgi:hypothetical protein